MNIYWITAGPLKNGIFAKGQPNAGQECEVGWERLWLGALSLQKIWVQSHHVQQAVVTAGNSRSRGRDMLSWTLPVLTHMAYVNRKQT